MLICGCQGLGVLSLLASVALLSVQSEGSKWTGLTKSFFNDMLPFLFTQVINKRRFAKKKKQKIIPNG